jgi:hypothetical protein
MTNEWASLFSSPLVDIDNIRLSHTAASLTAQVTDSHLENNGVETDRQSQHAWTMPQQGPILTRNNPTQEGMPNMTTSPSNILENGLGVAYSVTEATPQYHEEYVRYGHGPTNRTDSYAIPIDAPDPKGANTPDNESIHSQAKSEPRNMSLFIKAGVKLAFLVRILNDITEINRLMIYGQELMQEYTHDLKPEDLLSIRKEYKTWLMGAR